MPTIDDVYASASTLRAEHLPPGRPALVVIDQVTPKDFDDGRKLEITFRGKQRVLLCNKTNAHAIADVVGTRDYTQWLGRSVWLIRSQTDFRGKLVECVRIELNPPAVPASQLPPASASPAPDDDIPF